MNDLFGNENKNKAKDWVGSQRSSYATLGASNHVEEEREENDYYATEPKAVSLLLELEKFAPVILEPACGEGHISKVLWEAKYTVLSQDLIYRGYGSNKPCDFLKRTEMHNGDIITNPPYKYAQEFVEKALEIIPAGNKVAMFLKTLFVESAGRKELFKNHPPKTIYVSSSRLACAKNGVFDKDTSRAVSYSWFIWEKGYKGETIVKWFN